MASPQPAAQPLGGPEHGKNMQGKRPFEGRQGGKNHKKFKMKKKPKPAGGDGSPEEVLMFDIQDLLARQKLSDGAEMEQDPESLPERGDEILVDVLELSSTGDGLAKQEGSDQIYVVPFTVPGDMVKVKAYHHNADKGYWNADFLSVVDPSPLRDDSRIKCKYFAHCSGCQFQMLDYSEQLKHKKTIVEKAYRNFSQLPAELVPSVLDTIGSPLQYGYRTKLTPHFDGPPGAARRGPKTSLTSCPSIGFTPKTSRKVLDIEDCPIATDAVRKGLSAERARMAKEFGNYKRGATILLRENTKRAPKTSENRTSEGNGATEVEDIPKDAVKTETERYTDYKNWITDNNATSTEYIDDFVFTNPAGSFFQNNNSILPPFTEYIRQHALPPNPPPGQKAIRNLIDAYSGSGLFTITQSSLFPGGSIGIDIADQSISFARRNAVLNGLNEEQCRFIAADAPELFKSVAAYDADETVVILDPPRKGCDASFLRQLLQFAPRRVLYVSCNVHTQARDVGVLVRGEVEDVENGGDAKAGGKGVRYEIESIRGFDFFPQTGHVEGVAVLNRVDS
ncbi:S-adenosyl-L-methionine-dependent methyltransferase [Thozetella sp. PMI_491]|nr:S-adenosyl-L-methionine-dependent methyltransferase [Thozetella sp. PMI_491]